MTNTLKVLVTGATGRTGSLVLQKLQALPEQFTAKGFGRSPHASFLRSFQAQLRISSGESCKSTCWEE